MNWGAFLLLGLGLLLIFIEFFVPGGILGIAGGVLIIMSIVFFAASATSGWAVILFIVAAIILLILLVKFALWRIRKWKGGIFLNSDQEGYSASLYAKDVVGKQGEALSDLKPSGHILIEGKRYQAVSKMGYISKGSKIVVSGGEGAHLFVKIYEEEKK